MVLSRLESSILSKSNLVCEKVVDVQKFSNKSG